MKKKLWLKQDPAITAEIQVTHGDDTCALLHNPKAEEGHPTTYLGFIKMEEWSDTEMVPVPACAGESLWVAVVGEENPLDVTYVTFDNEVALRVALATQEDILGWFQIPTPASMHPVG